MSHFRFHIQAVSCGICLSLSDFLHLVWSCLYPSMVLKLDYVILFFFRAPQVTPVVKNMPASAGDIRDTDLIRGWGRSYGGGHSNPLQWSCLENPMDRGAWWTTVAKSQTWLKWLRTCILFLWLSNIALCVCVCVCVCLCVGVYTHLYPFICQWTLRLLPHLGC